MKRLGRTLGVITLLSATSTSAALFSAESNVAVTRLTGAAFTSSVAPVPVPTLTPPSVALSWPTVSINSGAPISYLVERQGSDGSTANVCVGANSPVVSGNTATCTDSTPKSSVTYSYRQTAQLLRSGLPTWTLGPSATTPIVVPTIYLRSIGPVAITPKNGSAPVSIPTGTAQGDLLLLVITSTKNSEPRIPSGWTRLASIGAGGGSASHLLVAYRIANTASSVTITSTSGGTTIAGRVIRFSKWSLSNPEPVLAVNAAAAGRIATPQGLIPGSLMPNKRYSTVISFVVTAGSHDLSLSTANGFNLAQSDTYGVGGGNETFGFSTRVVESSGVSVPLPTWEATPVTTDWLYALVAFA